MAAEEAGGKDGNPTAAAAGGWKERIEDQWRKTKEHAETYPYVWASYVLVYGGLGIYGALRWRKLRRTEERVRGLQARLKKLVEAEESSAAAAGPTASNSHPSPPEKPSG